MQITSGLPEGFNAGAYDMIVVGAGYAGAVCARRLAETIGYRVAVLERRATLRAMPMTALTRPES